MLRDPALTGCLRCMSPLVQRGHQYGRAALEAGATRFNMCLTTGKSSTRDTYGILLAYCRTVGINAANKRQNPYPCTIRPINAQPNIINAVPPKKQADPIRCFLLVKNLIVDGMPIVSVIPDRNMMLPNAMRALSRNSKIPARGTTRSHNTVCIGGICNKNAGLTEPSSSSSCQHRRDHTNEGKENS